MHGGKKRHSKSAKQWQMQPIDVGVTSNCLACRAIVSRRAAIAAAGSDLGLPRRSARGQAGCNLPRVPESPLANSVTSCPSSTNASISHATTRSGAAVKLWGNAFGQGAIGAMRIVLSQSVAARRLGRPYQCGA